MDYQQYLDYFAYVGNTLGKGYAECVYHEAVCVMLRRAGVSYSKEVPLSINFMDTTIGSVRADIIVETHDLVIECKATEATLKPSCISQIVNYMELTSNTKGFLVNFNQHPSKEMVEIFSIQKLDNGTYEASNCSDKDKFIFSKHGQQLKL